MRLIMFTLAALLLACLQASAAPDESVEVNLLDGADPAAVVIAKKSKDKKGPGYLLDKLVDIVKAAGEKVEGANDLSEVVVEGEDNEYTRIDTVNITISIGDIMLNNTEQGGGPELAGRLMEIIGGLHGDMGGMPGGGPHPPMPHMDGMHEPGPDHGMNKLDFHNSPRFPMEMHGEHGRHFEDRFELFSQIPPEVDTDFIRFMMHVGMLAWERPGFRERLEQMVMRVEHADQEQRRDH